MDIQVGNIVKLKKSTLRQQGMGGPAGGRRLQAQVSGLRPSDHGSQEACGKNVREIREKA